MNKEKEIIIISAVMAFMGAIGSVALVCALFGVDVVRLGIGNFMGFVTGLSGIFFTILMLGNFH